MDINTKLDNKWNLWYHYSKNDWSIHGYKNLFTIETIKDFWDLTNSWEDNGGIHKNEYFLMKENVQPIWEDKSNENGGCWSYKKKEEQSQQLWDDLASYLVSGNLSKELNLINGLSISKKKNGWIVIKIWNNDINKSSLKHINYDILKKWGLDLIYIAHPKSKKKILK